MSRLNSNFTISVAVLAMTLSPVTLSAQTRDATAKTAEAPVGTKAGEEWSDNGLAMTFCWCPPGSFTMGSPANEALRGVDEDQVSVKISSGFWLAKYELTQSQWMSVMGRQPWSRKKGIREGSDYAASYIGWEDATEFCNELTRREHAAGRLPIGWEYRLPTEAQWEYACRAGTTTAYSFGNDESDLRTYARFAKDCLVPDGQDYAHVVGEKRPNNWGLHDMYGNVGEWCRDWHADKLPGGIDPEQSRRASARVQRGGTYHYDAGWCRSASRYSWAPSERFSDTGFRVALVGTASSIAR